MEIGETQPSRVSDVPPSSQEEIAMFLIRYRDAKQASPSGNRIVKTKEGTIKTMGINTCISSGFVAKGIAELSHSSGDDIQQDTRAIITELDKLNKGDISELFLLGGALKEDEVAEEKKKRWQKIKEEFEKIASENPNIKLTIIPVDDLDTSMSIGIDVGKETIDIIKDVLQS